MSSNSMNRQICPQTSVFCENHMLYNCPTHPSLPQMSRMCPPIDYNHYYRQYFDHYLAHNVITCCQSSHQNIEHFCHNCCANELFARNPSLESKTDIIQEFNDYINGNEEELGSVSTIEVNDKCDSYLDNSCIDLKSINETLKQKLIETQLSVIKFNEKMCLDFIENYQNCIKKYGDYIKFFCTLFYRNDSMATKFEPIVEQINKASIKVNEEKKRICREFSAEKAMISEDIVYNYNVLLFDSKSLPQFPEVNTFYKSLIDEIHVQFVDDLNLIKRSAEELIKWKSNIDSNVANEQSVKAGQQLFEIPVNSDELQLKTYESNLGVIQLPFTSTINLKTNTYVNQINDKVFGFSKESETIDTISESQSSNSCSVQKQSLNMKESVKSGEMSSFKVNANEVQIERDELKHKQVFREELKISKCFHQFIIGKYGSTKRQIEVQTNTSIKVPLIEDVLGCVVISSSSKSNLKSAKDRITSIVESNRLTLDLTHFVSIPLNHDSIRKLFKQFMSEVLNDNECKSKGIDKLRFQLNKKLHLTIAPLLLCDENEIKTAFQILKDFDRNFIRKLINGKEIRVRIEGLYHINDDATQVDAIYSKIVDLTQNQWLHKIVNELFVRFDESKLTMRSHEFKRVCDELYVTLFNTNFRQTYNKYRRDDRHRNDFKPKTHTFDATPLISGFGNYCFGETIIKTIDISIIPLVGKLKGRPIYSITL